MTKPKVIIVDDHDIFRDGLVSLLILKKIANVIGVASNGKEFLEVLKEEQPDLVLMDISMPVMDGHKASIEAIKMLPDLNILVLSMFGDERYYYKMIDAGVKGFILKSSGKDELLEAIKSVASGNCYFSNELLRNVIVKFGKKEEVKRNTKKFTKRELEILNLMCNGLSAMEVAENLSLSKKTIEGHRTHLFNKTNTKTSVALIIYAIKNKMVYV